MFFQWFLKMHLRRLSVTICSSFFLRLKCLQTVTFLNVAISNNIITCEVMCWQPDSFKSDNCSDYSPWNLEEVSGSLAYKTPLCFSSQSLCFLDLAGRLVYSETIKQVFSKSSFLLLEMQWIRSVWLNQKAESWKMLNAHWSWHSLRAVESSLQAVSYCT